MFCAECSQRVELFRTEEGETLACACRTQVAELDDFPAWIRPKGESGNEGEIGPVHITVMAANRVLKTLSELRETPIRRQSRP